MKSLKEIMPKVMDEAAQQRLLQKTDIADRTLQCVCGWLGEPRLEEKSNGGIKATCSECGAYLKFVRQRGNEKDLLKTVLNLLPRLGKGELKSVKEATQDALSTRFE